MKKATTNRSRYSGQGLEERNVTGFVFCYFGAKIYVTISRFFS